MGFLIDMIKVGEGDSFLLTLDSEGGEEVFVLVDAGLPEQGDTVVEYARKYAPGGLDLIIATHIDRDHIGGMPKVLGTCVQPDQTRLILNVPPRLTETWRPLRKTLDAYGKVARAKKLTEALDMVDELVSAANRSRVKISGALAGRSWACGDVVIRVLNPSEARLQKAWEETDLLRYVNSKMPEDLVEAILELEEAVSEAPATSAENDASIVLEVEYKGTPNALLTGDAGAAVLKEVTGGKSYSFLKVPHHGSETGLDEDLVKQIAPKTAFIPVGDNPHGHPARTILKMLKQNKVSFYCSDKTSSCKGNCREGGFQHLSQMFDRAGHPDFVTAQAGACPRVASV